MSYVLCAGAENLGPMLYSLVRFTKPARVLEVGAGYTSMFLLQALEDNAAELEVGGRDAFVYVCEGRGEGAKFGGLGICNFASSLDRHREKKKKKSQAATAGAALHGRRTESFEPQDCADADRRLGRWTPSSWGEGTVGDGTGATVWMQPPPQPQPQLQLRPPLRPLPRAPPPPAPHLALAPARRRPARRTAESREACYIA